MPEKILLVDDDPLILQGYRRSLSREFPMETALGGAEALKLATGNAPLCGRGFRHANARHGWHPVLEPN
jgi:ActR/RegA family two-component response regulator